MNFTFLTSYLILQKHCHVNCQTRLDIGRIIEITIRQTENGQTTVVFQLNSPNGAIDISNSDICSDHKLSYMK